MSEYLPLLAAAVALLAGLAIGKAWERYKLRDGRWVDRRKVRSSPHYVLGLNFLVSNQIDLAIEELSKAAGLDADGLETHVILGNLYRERGQVGRAIQVHQSLLQRPNLSRLEHAYVLLCLGLDFKRGGFVDRAFEAFSEVLRLDPHNRYALLNLEKLHTEQHQWTEAHAVRQRLIELGGPDELPQSRSILAFLETELGMDALKRDDVAEARRRFEAAIEQDGAAIPAHLTLGDTFEREHDLGQAASAWERLLSIAPERAYLAFERLERAYLASDDPERFQSLCQRLIAGNPQDWRARLALARHLGHRGRSRESLDLLLEALVQNPHGLVVHQAIWDALSDLGFPPEHVKRYVDVTRQAVFYLDPHICLKCRYRSTELLWQCPHCHEWNTFVEERIAAARDEAEIRA